MSYVSDVKIPFEEGTAPCQTHYRPSVLPERESHILAQEIKPLLEKGVLQQTQYEPGEFISPIFLRPKSDGSCRMILNLKEINKSVEYHDFKMNTLDTGTKLTKPGCCMASVDLKDAYYTVLVHRYHQKYLKFEFKGCLYQYTCPPNGLSSAPRIFAKLLKPVYSTSHNKGHISTGYIDDSYLQGDTIAECRDNIVSTVELFTKLGFYIHPTKSIFSPTQILVFLGFILNSVTMKVSPTPEKMDKTITACLQLLKKDTPLIIEVARVINIIVSNFPGAEYGPLHYRLLEHDKTKAFSINAGNFNNFICVSKGITLVD